jgi:hypothetical protein
MVIGGKSIDLNKPVYFEAYSSEGCVSFLFSGN